MIFFLGETPDGWGVPGIHGMLAEDELDGYVQGAVYLIRGYGENLLVDTGNWTLPEFNNGMGEFLIKLLDKEKNRLKYIFLTHFHYDHTGNAALLKKRYGAQVVCHPADRPIIEDPLIVTREEKIREHSESRSCSILYFGKRECNPFRLLIEPYRKASFQSRL